MPPRRSLLLLVAGVALAACADGSLKLPLDGTFGTTTTAPSDSAAPEGDSSEPPSCASEDCGGCCDESGACIEPLEDDACGRPGQDCVDCTTEARSCDTDGVCINPETLPEGQVNDQQLRLASRTEAERVRADLIFRVFGTTELPSLAPSRLTSDVADPFESTDTTLISVERAELDLPGGTTTPFWVVVPEAPSGRLVLVHQGHWHTLKEGKLDAVAHAALAEGAIVVGLTMPLYGESTGPDLTHDDLIAHFPADLPGHGLQVFLQPVISAIDHVQANHTIDTIAMVGISGGGWTTVLAAAVDPRITHSISVAGSLPLFQREGADWGDREQHDPSIYEVAGYPDLHTLGALEDGRHQRLVLHRYDTCCFAGTGYRDWEPAVQRALSDLSGGSFEVFLDESIRGHEVSDFALAAAVRPVLAQQSVRYFDESLPAYGVLTTSGTWTRDASAGFGADSARAPTGSATWTIPVPAGPWSAALTWEPDASLSSSVPVDIEVDGATTNLLLDQTTPPESFVEAGARWQTLGSGSTDHATALTVTLHASDGSDVRLDGIRVEAAWSP